MADLVTLDHAIYGLGLARTVAQMRHRKQFAVFYANGDVGISCTSGTPPVEAGDVVLVHKVEGFWDDEIIEEKAENITLIMMMRQAN